MTGPSDAVPIYGTCGARFDGVRKIFEQNFASGTDLGSAVCFTLDGEPVVDLWGGYLDRERTREWQWDTIVSTAFTTKGMTSICAHQLIEQGRLDLDAPTARYWPEFAAGGKETLRVRWLLSHQAGLPAVSKPLPEGALFDWDTMTSALADQEPWWEPGTKHGYHALTFGYLVGELVRRVSGRSVGTYFREHVAEPLEADFHIGLSPEQETRVSDIHGSPMPCPEEVPQFLMEGPFGDLLRDMEDPSTMTGAAFSNPRLKADAMNSRAWRAAEIPAGNGHGTARALARIYGALARGGEVDGVRILEKGTIERAIDEQANGPDAVLGGLPMRFGLGFMLRQDLVPLSPNPRAFGHPGAGGSIGMADPDAKVGFGYVLNQSQTGITGAMSAFAMIGAFFEAL
jgi:CubicO group peptidase (beta-lactamase class C family)